LYEYELKPKIPPPPGKSQVETQPKPLYQMSRHSSQAKLLHTRPRFTPGLFYFGVIFGLTGFPLIGAIKSAFWKCSLDRINSNYLFKGKRSRARDDQFSRTYVTLKKKSDKMPHRKSNKQISRSISGHAKKKKKH
jgi:hypothetical protein